MIQQTIYQIRVKGHLGPQWADWFGGMTIKVQRDGDTLLSGAIIDQAALYGLLRKVRDLGMPLVSVNQVKRQALAPKKKLKRELRPLRNITSTQSRRNSR